jgi:hypothetical protein
MLGSVVAVAFQITFCAEMHAKKKLNFLGTRFARRSQTGSKAITRTIYL